MRSRHRGSAKRRRSWLIADACLSGVLLAAAELEVVLDGLGAESAALAAVATLPLVLRRRAPVAAFCCVAVLAPTLDHAFDAPWGSAANAPVFLVLIAAYSLGAHASLWRSLPAVLAALVWLSAVDALWGDSEDLGFLFILLGVPWLSGRGVRRYRRQAERLRELAARLREERAVSERAAVARERQRMAHETDDAIAHSVGVMALQAAGAEQVLKREPERARRALVAVQDTGREAVRELREVLGILRVADEQPVPPVVGDPPAPAAPAGTSCPFPWTARVDAGLATAVLALGVAYAATDAAVAGMRAPAVLVQVAAAAAVLLCRRRPFPALALSLLAYASEALLGGSNPGSPATIAAVLLTTFSAAAQGDRHGAAVAAMFALGVPALVTRGDAADVLLPLTVFATPWLAGRAISAYRRQGEALTVLATRLERERDARARLAAIDERARVARELHDSVGHAISVMVLQAGAAEQVVDCDPDRAAEAVRAIQATAREAHDDLGTLLGLLDPADGQPPLAPHLGLGELERLIAAVRQAGLPVQLRVIGDPERLPAGVDGAAYRVIQEALTNALKHAAAAPTTVTVRYASDGVHLDVVDEGPGTVSSPAAGGYGLVGMRARVVRHGGRLHAGSASGGSGFAVSAFLPLAPAPEQRPERVNA